MRDDRHIASNELSQTRRQRAPRRDALGDHLGEGEPCASRHSPRRLGSESQTHTCRETRHQPPQPPQPPPQLLQPPPQLEQLDPQLEQLELPKPPEEPPEVTATDTNWDQNVLVADLGTTKKDSRRSNSKPKAGAP